MNNNSYYNPVYPMSSLPSGTPNQQVAQTITSNLDEEQSYIENILRLNKGKKAKFHVTVPGSEKWQDRVFDGIIEQAGRDHLIVSNPSTGEWYLILMIYLDFVTFEETVNYLNF